MNKSVIVHAASIAQCRRGNVGGRRVTATRHVPSIGARSGTQITFDTRERFPETPVFNSARRRNTFGRPRGPVKDVAFEIIPTIGMVLDAIIVMSFGYGASTLVFLNFDRI